jgi:hypothetical protein
VPVPSTVPPVCENAGTETLPVTLSVPAVRLSVPVPPTDVPAARV